MTDILGQDKPPLGEVLEHHGVKGMKWGVHRENRLQLNRRVAAGKGTKLDNARVVVTQVSNANRIASGGTRGAAQNKARELASRKYRIQRGQATVRDFIALHGGDKVLDRSHVVQKERGKVRVNHTLKVIGAVLAVNAIRGS